MVQESSRALMRRSATHAARLSLAGALLALASPASRVGAQEGTGSNPTENPAVAQQPANAAEQASEATPQHKPELHLMEDRLTIREPFNAATDATRIMAFLSPSCPRCLKNAGQLQKNVLDANPDANIAAFVVWMFVRNDDNEEVALEAVERIPDPRVRHYWDPDRKLIHQLRDAIMFDVNMRVYDIFFLYGTDAVWEKRLPRPDYWMHEFKGVDGPWWNVAKFASEVTNGLNGEPFADPWK